MKRAPDPKTPIEEHFVRELRRFVEIRDPPRILLLGQVGLRHGDRGTSIMMNLDNGPWIAASFLAIGTEALRVHLASRSDEAAHLVKLHNIQFRERFHSIARKGFRCAVRTQNWLTASHTAELIGKMIDARRSPGV